MDLNSEIDKLLYYYSYHTTLVLEMNVASNYFWKTQLEQLRRIQSDKDYVPVEERNPDKYDKLGFSLFEKFELIKEHSPKMSLIYLFSLFEAFNKDFFQTLFKYKPELMKSKKKQINYDTILKFSDINELHEYITQKEVNQYGYFDIDAIAQILMDKFKINLKEELKYWEQLRENYYRRNLIVHNDGKISSVYLKKFELSDKDLNKELKCDDTYLEECCRNIQNYIDFIYSSIKKKFYLTDIFEK